MHLRSHLRPLLASVLITGCGAYDLEGRFPREPPPADTTDTDGTSTTTQVDPSTSISTTDLNSSGLITSGDDTTSTSGSLPNPPGIADTGAQPTACDEAAAQGSLPYHVFATQFTVAGDLQPPDSANIPIDGLSGVFRGDRICQCLAERAGLNGAFLAWLSGPTTEMSDLLGGDLLPRHFITPDNRCVAESWGVLFSEDHKAAISSTANGTPIEPAPSPHIPPARAWTGTLPDGDWAEWYACEGWTSTSKHRDGRTGILSHSDSTWTDSENTTCDTQNHLYCVQVGDPSPNLDLKLCP